jgi:hypothetical protein
MVFTIIRNLCSSCNPFPALMLTIHSTSGTSPHVHSIYGICAHYPLLFRHRALIFQHNNVECSHWSTSKKVGSLCTTLPEPVLTYALNFRDQCFPCSQCTRWRLHDIWFYKYAFKLITVVWKAYLKKFLTVKNYIYDLHFDHSTLKSIARLFEGMVQIRIEWSVLAKLENKVKICFGVFTIFESALTIDFT